MGQSLSKAWLSFKRLLGARSSQKTQYIRRLEDSQGYLQEHIAKLDALAAMLADLSRLGLPGSGVSRRTLCEAAVADACRLLQIKKASFLLVDAGRRTLSLAAARGFAEEISDFLQLPANEGAAGYAVQTGKTIWLEDIRTDTRFLRDPQPPLESAAMICVPLNAKDRVIGVLIANGEDGRIFEGREIRLLVALADQAAQTLENMEWGERMRRFNLELAQTLVQALDAKISPLNRQTERLRRYAQGVARELALPEQLAQHVEYAVLMREVGKISIGEHILRKPGKLTDEEYSVMKKHPEIGSRILSPVEFLAPVAPMVLYHQEWFNGQGYPEGLSGEEIPLGARIVSVLGAWEAMTSDRPYRRALAREKALEELRRAAGSQFDPRVVQAFLRFLERDQEQAPSVAN